MEMSSVSLSNTEVRMPFITRALSRALSIKVIDRWRVIGAFLKDQKMEFSESIEQLRRRLRSR